MSLSAGEARPQIVPGISTIREAQKFLAKYLAATRLIPAPFLSQTVGKNVYLKLETELPNGSFKVRGALWALAQRLKRGPVQEVVACSTGNHGAAVAYAAKEFGIKARIFLPANCNPVKRGRIVALGAAITESEDSDPASAFALVAEYAKEPGVFFLNDASDEDLPAGPATIGCEILEQLPGTSAIVVPMGDTALIRGIAAAANVRDVKSLVDEVVLVSEEQILRAIETLLLEEHVIAEPAGAASTAALLQISSGYGDNIALVVSGTNISREVLKRAIGSV